VAKGEEAITTHRFVYHGKIKKKEGHKELVDGSTDVYDAHNYRTTYAYNTAHRLTSITRYAKDEEDPEETEVSKTSKTSKTSRTSKKPKFLQKLKIPKKSKKSKKSKASKKAHESER
jgi:YD repeat-containing protein